MRLDQLLGWQLVTWFAFRSEGLLQRRDLREQWDPEAHVSTSYGAFQDVANGLHHVKEADSNSFASVIVTPELVNGVEFVTNGQSSGTHLSYNCTSTSALWNLEHDPKVVNLEGFEMANGDVGGVAIIRVLDCSDLVTSAVGRVVTGNSFFGEKFGVYLYVVNAVALDDTKRRIVRSKSTTHGCQVRLEVVKATFAQIYPNCRIKFRSTDIDNLVRTESHEAVQNSRRKLEASSFGFVKDSSCKYDCGEESDAGSIEADKCWAKDAGSWTEVQCKVQFYEKNSQCSTECGYESDSEALPSDQCYDCSSSDVSCDSSFSKTDDGCCRVLQCKAVEATMAISPGTLAWNLDDDALTVSNSSYPIFESGNCSDTSDPSTDCCRVTCENCFVNVSIASMFADVEIVALSYDEAIEMELMGNANLEVALFAPNGCTLDETTQLKNASFTIPLGETGISVEVTMGLDLRRKLSLQPHGSTAFVGATAQLQSLTAGSLRSEKFYDVQITSNMSNMLAQSGIDVGMELELIPSFQGSLLLLKGAAQVGIKAEFGVFLDLNSTFQSPEPFAGLSTKYLDESSLWHGGDCRLPHFMEYNCNAGYGKVNISIPLSINVPPIGNTTSELEIVSSSGRSSYSLFSGCVATAYDAEIILLTAIDTVSSLNDEKKEALQTILTWALGMTDIDPDFVNISSVSAATGEISITLSVPPSLGTLYPNASDFKTEVYGRARNASFASRVTDYVGVQVAAQCDDSWWGAACNETCSRTHCTSANISCNAVDGTVLACGPCKDGYWGSLCDSICEIPDSCTSARCNQTDGSQSVCVSCKDGDSSLCEDVASSSVSSVSIGSFFFSIGLQVGVGLALL